MRRTCNRRQKSPRLSSNDFDKLQIATLQSGSWTSYTGTIGGEGTVVIPATGTVDLGADPAIGRHRIVTAPHLEYPDDFSGWAVKGLPAGRYRFRVKGNA